MKNIFSVLFLLFCGVMHSFAQVDNYSLKLSSQGNVIFNHMSELDNLSSYTIQFWLNVSEWNKGSVIYSQGDGFKASLGEPKTLEFIVGNKTIKGISDDLVVDNWCQISFFCNEGKGEISINGVTVYNGDETLSAIPASESNFIIGGQFNGKIDEFRIWKALLAKDYDCFRNNTLNKWAPQWNDLVAYYKFDQNQCDNVVDYTFKYHGVFSSIGAERAIVTDNEKFKYRISAAYSDFSRFFDRAIDREKYLLSNDLIVLGINSYNDGSLKISYPNNHGVVANGEYLNEYEGREGVLSLKGEGAGMVAGLNALTPTDKYTFETWIYLETWQEGAYIFSKESEDATSGFSIRLGGEENKQIIVRLNGNEYISQKKMKLNQWVHFAVTTWMTGEGGSKLFLFCYNGVGGYATQSISSTKDDEWLPRGNEQIEAVLGKNINAKFDNTVIWHVGRDASGIASDMASLPMPDFDTVVTASVLHPANSYWMYDNPEDLGYDSYSYKHFINIMRRAYDGYRGYHIRMSVSSHDGWQNTFADAQKRIKFAADLAKIAEEFDGVDLDFEWCYGDYTCWDNYGKLILEIDKVLGKDKILTVSPHYVSYSLQPKYMEPVDYFTFQIYGPGSHVFIWNNYLDAYNKFTAQGFPKGKILMSYATTTSRGYKNGQEIAGAAPIGVRNGLLDGNYTPDMNIVNDGTYDRYITGFNQTYERAKYTQDKDLTGIFYWDMGNDVKTWHKYSLVKAASYALNSNVDTLVTKVDNLPTSIERTMTTHSQNDKLMIYTNRGTGSISFGLPENVTPYRVQVFDMKGLCVINKETDKSTLVVDSLPGGYYAVSLLTTSGKLLNGKFLKK
ncbi:LamG-like jellyroll fold domain-containing protein [Bacteroides sp.]